MNNDALTLSYRRYFPLIREKCRRVVGDGDDAQDLAQETLVKLWKSRLPLDDARQVTAWVYRTATRLCIDRLRRRAVRAAQATPADVDEHTPLEALAQRRLLSQLSREVPATELEVVVLHRLDELTQVEIAEVLAISERTVRRLLERFDERFRDAEARS